MTASAIPRMSRGANVVARSLFVATPKISPASQLIPWSEGLVRPSPLLKSTVVEPMATFGYGSTVVRRHGDIEDCLGFVGPIQPITDVGIGELARICIELADRAPENPHVVSKRLRGADAYSPFLHDMVRSQAFLRTMSELAGVPLMVHPHPDAAVQINYYIASETTVATPQVAKWHTDGMDYVFTLLLTEGSEYDGGEFQYFRGTKQDFDSLDGDPPRHQCEQAQFTRMGEGIFSRGSQIYHGVTPVTRGHRITLVVSLFCPFFHRTDSNRFWHSAPDDGLFRTARNWLRFKPPWLSPNDFVKRAAYAVPNWKNEDANT